MSGGNLGTVLDTYGGKSLKRIVAVGAAVFGGGLTAALVIRAFRPDYPVLATVLFAAGVVIALGYVSTSWGAALAKVEIGMGGVRLLRRDAVTELPWDRILQIRVGYFGKLRGRPEHVVIRTTDGKDVELPSPFWDTVGTERFLTTVHRFVEHVKEDVDFSSAEEGRELPGARTMRQEPVFGLWFGTTWPPCFLGIFVGMTFALGADGPAWETWVGRVVVTLFCWLISFLAAGFTFRELRRRGEWLPPGGTRRPWLAAAAYAAGMLVITSAVVAALLVCLELVTGTEGRAGG